MKYFSVDNPTNYHEVDNPTNYHEVDNPTNDLEARVDNSRHHQEVPVDPPINHQEESIKFSVEVVDETGIGFLAHGNDGNDPSSVIDDPEKENVRETTARQSNLLIT